MYYAGSPAGAAMATGYSSRWPHDRVPVVLLPERRWLAIASALVTTAVLVAATAMLFDFDIWIAFLQKVVPQQAWLTNHGDGPLFAMVASVLFGARFVGLPLAVGWAAQLVVSALALAALAWTYWKRRDPTRSFALFVTAIFLFTPYILNYDMVVLSFVVALLLARVDNAAGDRWLLFAVWSLPIAMMFAAVGDIPLAPIVLIAFAARLPWRLAHDRDAKPRCCRVKPQPPRPDHAARGRVASVGS